MLRIIDFKYYNNTYKGTSIPLNSFDNASLKASSRINKYAFKRINENNINDDIKNAACEIAELIYSQDLLKSGIDDTKITIKSETVGPHTVQYSSENDIKVKRILSDTELERECYRICHRYFFYTGLMDRSVY